MEMIWIPEISTGSPSEMFTHVFFKHYSAPPGYCFDILCDDDPIMPDKSLEEYNLDEKT